MEKNDQMISQYLFEAIQARNERTVRRLWIALVVAIALAFASNALWLYAWTEYDYVSAESVYRQDGEGTNIMSNNVIGDENNVQQNPFPRSEHNNSEKKTNQEER